MSAALSAIQTFTTKFRRTLSVMAVLALAFNPVMPLVSLMPVQAAAADAVTNQDTTEGFANLQDAIDDSDTDAGDTLLVNQNLSITDDVDVTKEVIINGQGFTLTGDYVKTSSSNNSVLTVQADNVTVTNVTVDGQDPTANQLHGVNVFNSANVLVENITARNFRSGVLYVSSTGTIRDITTSGNIWHAINVDRSSNGSLSGSNVTVEGTNSHAENSPNPTNDFTDGVSVPHLFQDDATDGDIVVSDVGNQYGLNEVSFRGGVALVGTYGASQSPTSTTEIVTGDTSDGTSDGWVFGNPAPFDTVFEFVDEQPALGDGSLKVGPVAADAQDKFIGYYIVNEQMRNVETFSYNFLIDNSTAVSKANEFYLNVYTQFETPEGWYDCRYNVVPSVGSTSAYTTLTFNTAKPTSSVTQNGATSTPCPNRPLAMGANAMVMYMTLNVGDTSANDLGVTGHYDNISYRDVNGLTTFDFETADEENPQTTFTSPNEGESVKNTDITGTITDNENVSQYSFNVNGPGSNDWTTRKWTPNTTSVNFNLNLCDEDRLNLCNEADLPDGEYKVRVAAYDGNGNRDISTNVTFAYDSTTPSPPTITNPGARTWHRNTTIVNSWTSVTDQSGIDYYQAAYRYDDGHTFSNSTCPGEEIDGVTLSGCRNTSNTSRNHTPAASEQMGVTLWVRAVDNAGNVGSWSESVHYYYDNTNPATDIVVGGFEDNVNRLTDHEFTVSGTATDNLSLNRLYVQLVNRQDNKRYGGTTIDLIGEGVSADWSKTYNANVMNLPNGDYAAHVSVVDRAGNTASAGWTDDFTIDSSAPENLELSYFERNSNDELNSGDATDEEYFTFELTADSEPTDWTVKYWNDIDGSSYNGESNAWTTSSSSFITINGNDATYEDRFSQGEGQHFFTFEACDAVGNCSPFSQPFMIAFDETPPAISDNFTVTHQVGQQNAPLLEPTITDRDGADLTYEWIIVEPTPTKPPLAPNTGPTLQLDPGPVGTYQLVLSATDDAGNRSEATYNVTVTPASESTNDGETGQNDVTTGIGGNPDDNAGNQTGPLAFASNTAGGQQAQAGVIDDGDVESEFDDNTDESDEDGETLQTADDGTDENSQDDDEEGDNLPLWWWLIIGAIAAGGIWLVVARRDGSSD